MGSNPPDGVSDLFGTGFAEIKRYVDILLDRGIAWGLLGPREGERIWERHILNSVALSPLVPEGSRLVDVGSGAGLPGLPLAILRPDLTVTLLDSLARRSEFLQLAVTELGLGDRVQVVRARAEEHRLQYEVVASRAVAPLTRLVAWCVPLLAADGRLLALKGETAAEELASVELGLRKAVLAGSVRELEVPVVGERTWAVEIRRR
jgi:16S rRNA (guanine527-N7)-methyltransferase